MKMMPGYLYTAACVCWMLVVTTTSQHRYEFFRKHFAPRPLPPPPPPPVVWFNPLPPKNVYPLKSSYSPVRNVVNFHNNRLWRPFYNAVSHAQSKSDVWGPNNMNEYYNGYYYILQTTTEGTTTESTTVAPTTTTNYYAKNPKFYDDYDDIIEIAPANAIMIALINAAAVAMLALGSPVTWLGRKRSVNDIGSDMWTDSVRLLNDGLLMGSSPDDGGQCVQRAACEVPRMAQVYAESVAFITEWLEDILPIILVNRDHLVVIAEQLQQVASQATDGIDCNDKFPCSKITYLNNAKDQAI